jgi:hypothetical protein
MQAEPFAGKVHHCTNQNHRQGDKESRQRIDKRRQDRPQPGAIGQKPMLPCQLVWGYSGEFGGEIRQGRQWHHGPSQKWGFDAGQHK